MIASDGQDRIAIQELTQAYLEQDVPAGDRCYKRENNSLRTMVNMQSLRFSGGPYCGVIADTRRRPSTS
jgi:hypothetical protein